MEARRLTLVEVEGVSRTPPGVRELKLIGLVMFVIALSVAPLPGCVN